MWPNRSFLGASNRVPVIGRLVALSLLVCSIQTGLSAQEIAVSDATELHEQAVRLARAGRYDESLELLAQLRQNDPENTVLIYDQIAALSWAGRDAEALALSTEIDRHAAPAYVLNAVAKSSRNLKKLEQAATWYRSAIEAEPDNVDGQIGLAMTLTDAEQYSEALETLNTALDQAPRNADVLQARAYVLQRLGELIPALNSYDAVLAIAPDHFEALRGKALVLRDLLLPRQALDLNARHPGILTDDEIARLEADDLAIRLRLAAETIYPEEVDGQFIDETIAAIETQLEKETAHEVELPLRYDRITGLAERGRAEEAVAAFEELEVPMDQIPAYVLASAGRSYLQLRKPTRALQLLIPASAAMPNNNAVQFAVIYAHLDLDDYESAMRMAEHIIASEPMFLAATDTPIKKGNPERIRAEVIAAIADASISQLEAAQGRLESLLNEAPHNSDLRHELASVYRGRGWLDRSLFEYEQVLTVDEDELYARVGHAYAQLEAQHFREVDATVADLNRHRSSLPVVQQLTRTWQIHNKSELLVEASTGESTGSTFGSDVYRMDALWFTRPIRYNYRGFVHMHDATADFPEGDAHRRRIGLGGEYRANRWTAAGELLADRDNSGFGLSGSFNWRMSDYWSLAGALEIDGNETQLRAYRAGIESNQAELAARYAPNELMAYGIGWRMVDYSDGNRGQLLFGDWRKRILARPRTKLDATAEVAASRNDSQDVPYFAPTSDLSYLVGARHEWRIRRRYDRVLSQVADLQLGQHKQSGFSSGGIWRARYALNADVSTNLFLRAGIQRSRMFYDGAKEYDTTLFVTLQARL